MSLVNDLIDGGWLKDDRVIEAFRKIKRVDFMSPGMEELSELNEALPIGFGQTISQPLVVAFMLELLQVKEREKILDVGAGSGWTTALLAYLTGEMGKVVALEVVPELKTFGETNVRKYDFVERGIAKFVCADGSKGYAKEAPFDKILASASVQPGKKEIAEIPEDWKSQLKVGGMIVAPVGSSIHSLIKKSDTEYKKNEYPGFIFVPLIEQ
jgi:protein-L-isoaspartate(D-aspartate) O-methyltransferase